ncbi:DNA-binding response regulator [Nocardioides szechwanensis]|uniref:Two component transcriptional regulator, LuxR family n=1 Tax=Nocardioides szechwanensis TaxID=1005944 RepID=A0A1H0K3T9_9ACTN|nr:response regulator transcription factor [Nocardioides szechwanensis]GEP35396.1 DNA-binding response regulator [Nocardioides szechwanensis]SDO50331.1 two component transcriptional regulator, LuxR family [Nocardioides szechwanensis]
MSASPIRIAIVNDYEIVVEGVAAVLAPYRDRIEVVELDSRMPVISDIDVLLYDTFGQVQGDTVDLDQLIFGNGSARVVIFTWNVQRELIDRALAHGAAGYLSKSISAEDLVKGIEAVHAGEVVVVPVEDGTEGGQLNTAWPGVDHGLSAREAEVIALITQGLSNQEIADRCYLSINSVKTYVRTAYRKMGVTRRSQAVLWGIAHGLSPDRSRTIDPSSTD